MKIVLEEVQLQQIVEFFKRSTTYANFIRHQLELIYKPLGKWSKAPNPNNNCETSLGVIDFFPHSDSDTWSVLNRFDTNEKVKKELIKIYHSHGHHDSSETKLMEFIEKNREDLFGPSGKYTQTLVDLNMTSIISGNKNEEYAVLILKNKFPSSDIKRFCSGDIRDTKKGIDISVETKLASFNVQVKPFIKVSSYVEEDGDTFFEVSSYLDISKYSERNVNILMFVNPDTNQFIMFSNKKLKMGQIRPNLIRFYEPPLYTNMEFITRQKRKMTNFEPTSVLFDQEKDILKNLYFRKDQIEKQIQKQLDKLKKME